MHNESVALPSTGWGEDGRYVCRLGRAKVKVSDESSSAEQIRNVVVVVIGEKTRDPTRVSQDR